MANDDLGLGSTGHLDNNTQKQSYNSSNGVATACKVTVYFVGFIALIAGVSFMEYDFTLTLSTLAGGFISCLILSAIAEIIKQLTASNARAQKQIEILSKLLDKLPG